MEHYTNSFSGSVNVGNIDRKWVGTQSGIIGTEGAKVKSDVTYIKGGIIANIDENGVDRGNLVADLGKLTAENIQDKDKSMNFGITGSLSQRERDPNVVINLKDENGNTIKTEDKLGTNYGASISGGNRERTVRATIGSGTLTTKEITGNVNRDISKSMELINEYNVGNINIDHVETKKGWGQMGEIFATDAAVIGALGDDLFNHGNNKYEGMFREGVYKNFRKVEDFVDKNLKNEILPIIPTSGQHGGMLEGIQKLFAKDEFGVYDLVIKKDKKGKTILDGQKLKDGHQIKTEEIFINGMTEESEGSIANALNQLISMKDLSNLKNGDENSKINITLIYSKTRGFIPDGLEAVLGKLFDGSSTNFGLTTGTSRRLADVLRQLNPNMKYNITTYSQANIIMLGALNHLINEGKKLNGNITLYHTGTPVANKAFDEIADKVNIINGVALINRPDPVGSEEGKLIGFVKGAVSETRDYTKDKKNRNEKIPFIGPSMFRDQVYVFMELPKYEDFKEGKKYVQYKEAIINNNNLRVKGDNKATEKNLKKFIENYHRWYRIEDRKYVKQMADLTTGINYQFISGENAAILNNKITSIRDQRNDELVQKWASGVPNNLFENQGQVIKDFRTNLAYNEYVDNLDTEWRNFVKMRNQEINPDYDILFQNINSMAGLSIDEVIKNMRGQVK